MRINWFAPDASTGSSSALFSQKVIPSLSEKAKISHWTSLPETVPWKEFNHADMNIYVIDRRNPEEEWISKVSQLSPGLIILISPLFSQIPTSNQNEFWNQVLQEHGFHGVYQIETRGNEAFKDIVIPSFGLKKALGLLLLSDLGLEELKNSVSYPIRILLETDAGQICQDILDFASSLKSSRGASTLKEHTAQMAGLMFPYFQGLYGFLED